MESIFLFLIVLIEAGVIIFQNQTIRKISEDALDRVAQKNANVYFPKDAAVKAAKDSKDEDRMEVTPLEDVSDEDFLKAVRKGAEDAK